MHPLAFAAYKYFMHEKRASVEAVCKRSKLKPNRIYDLVEGRIRHPEWRMLFNGMLLHRGASVKVLPDPDGLDREDIAEELQLLLEQATTLSKHDIRDPRNRELLVRTADALEAVADRIRIKLQQNINSEGEHG